MTTLTLYKGNDCVLEHLIREPIADTDIQSATVSYDLLDGSGGSVDSGSMSFAVTEILNSETYYKFRATLADTLSIVAGASYTVVLDVNAGAGLQGHWEIPITAEVRDS